MYRSDPCRRGSFWYISRYIGICCRNQTYYMHFASIPLHLSRQGQDVGSRRSDSHRSGSPVGTKYQDVMDESPEIKGLFYASVHASD